MFCLFDRTYRAVTRAQFAADLGAKDRVVLVRNDAGRICGFSTLSVSRVVIEGVARRVVFSGDTVIDRHYWGSQAFAFAWIREIGRIHAEAPDETLHWLLIVKGHRTFRYLSAFGLDFVPDWRGSECAKLTDLKNALARRYFGQAYDAGTGLVTYPQSRGHLAEAFAAISAREAERPDVQFFLQRNPGYGHGDELVCLCELSARNMRPLTRRLFLQGAAP